MELRKVLDTRAGRWFLAPVVLLAAACLAHEFTPTDRAPATSSAFFDTPLSVGR